MKELVCIILGFALFTAGSALGGPQDPITPKRPLKVGYNVSIKAITPDKMKYAKSVGIDYIEVGGFEGLINEDMGFVHSDSEMTTMFREAKKVLDEAGIKAWSIHMPGIATTDISLF